LISHSGALFSHSPGYYPEVASGRLIAMIHVLTVALPDDVAAKLRDLAVAQYRKPRDQATILLIEAIRQATVDGPGRDRLRPPTTQAVAR
jgi:hypothetical protein